MSIRNPLSFYLSAFFCKRKKHGKIVFSQEGEDLILSHLLQESKRGSYVDIGAFDPWRYSNTAFFYKQGWKGLNVDATPGFKAHFDRERPRDINVECVVGTGRRYSKFYLFDEAALNTTCVKRMKYLQQDTKYSSYKTVRVPTRTLASLLREFCADPIDFMSIDVEGAEMEVLKSGNWIKNRPKILVLEILDTSLEDLHRNPCIRFLRRQGYTPVVKSLRSVVLKDDR